MISLLNKTAIDEANPDASDRSTECESLSPKRPFNKKANAQLEKTRSNIKGLHLFSHSFNLF